MSLDVDLLLRLAVPLTEQAGLIVRSVYDSGELNTVYKDDLANPFHAPQPMRFMARRGSLPVSASSENSPLPRRQLLKSRFIAPAASHLLSTATVPVRAMSADPCTRADILAEALMVHVLHSWFPNLCIVGEEAIDDERATLILSRYFGNESQFPKIQPLESRKESWPVSYENVTVFIDPVDGTWQYTQGNVEAVTVLLGIAVQGIPVAGVVHQPFYSNSNTTEAVMRTFYGALNRGVFIRYLKRTGYCLNETLLKWTNQDCEQEHPIIVTTSTLKPDANNNAPLNPFLDALQPSQILYQGGCGYKALVLLDQRAHVYVMPFRGTKSWDTCAPHALICALGGKVTDLKGEALKYAARVTPPSPATDALLGKCIIPEEMENTQAMRVLEHLHGLFMAVRGHEIYLKRLEQLAYLQPASSETAAKTPQEESFVSETPSRRASLPSLVIYPASLNASSESVVKSIETDLYNLIVLDIVAPSVTRTTPAPILLQARRRQPTAASSATLLHPPAPLPLHSSRSLPAVRTSVVEQPARDRSRSSIKRTVKKWYAQIIAALKASTNSSSSASSSNTTSLGPSPALTPKQQLSQQPLIPLRHAFTAPPVSTNPSAPALLTHSVQWRKSGSITPKSTASPASLYTQTVPFLTVTPPIASLPRRASLSPSASHLPLPSLSLIVSPCVIYPRAMPFTSFIDVQKYRANKPLSVMSDAWRRQHAELLSGGQQVDYRKLTALVRGGVPDDLRGWVWCEVLRVEELPAHDRDYQLALERVFGKKIPTLIQAPSFDSRVSWHDVLVLSPTGRQAVRNVLCVLGHDYPHLDECRFLPPLVALLAHHMSAFDVLGCVVSMISRSEGRASLMHGASGQNLALAMQTPLSAPTPASTPVQAVNENQESSSGVTNEIDWCFFPLHRREIKLFVLVFTDLVARILPKLAKHTKKLRSDTLALAAEAAAPVPPAIALMPDYTSLLCDFFVGIYPLPVLFHVMDCFTVEGYKVLYRFALAHLQRLEVELRATTSLDAFNRVMLRDETEIPFTVTDLERWVQSAFTLSFTRASVQQMRLKLLREQARRRATNNNAVNALNNLTDMDTFLDEEENTRSHFFRPLPHLSHSSALLNEDDWLGVWRWVPDRYRLMDLERLFTTQTDGHYLQTLYEKCGTRSPLILLMETQDGIQCGAYLSEAWSYRDAKRFHGNGETFLFQVKPKAKVYAWIGLHRESHDLESSVSMPASPSKEMTQCAAYFIMGSTDFMAIGGGGDGYGLYLNSSLTQCSSQTCATFQNAPLFSGAPGATVECVHVEVYGFV